MLARAIAAYRILLRLCTWSGRFAALRSAIPGWIAALWWMAPLEGVATGTIQIEHLRCEYRSDPIGIDVVQPQLSWELVSSERGQSQTAYQILVMKSPNAAKLSRGDLWDSGKVLSDRSVGITYGGIPLKSREGAWWKVRVWDKDGRRSEWSPVAHWSMGLLDTSDWEAQWIADASLAKNLPSIAAGTNALPATMVRKAFRLDHPVRVARVYATALGLYELRINGQRVANHLLAPEWTSYSNRVQYQTYEVTSLLQPGTNVAAGLIGEGWYCGRLMAVGCGAYGSFPKFLMQLEVEYDDDSRQIVATDSTWRSTIDGPIRAAGIYDGESFDARREQTGWDTSDFDDERWTPVQVFALDGRKLVWQSNEPIQVEQELPCRKLTEPKPGRYVFDFEQNMVGWCRLTAQGIRGKTITLRHAEALNEDGTVYTANLRGAPQADSYTPAADGPFTFEPHFTYHGFRFIELAGLEAPPASNAVVGRVFHSAAPLVGSFECSDPSLNRLMQNVVWTERANLMSSPNDCPQRDERFGWMGDIQAFAQTAIFNMDLAAFCGKFAQDTRDDQARDGRFPDFAPHPGDPNAQFSGVPAWGDAGVFVPWCAYVNYADLRLLADQFEPARRWVEYIYKLNPDLIWTKGRNNDYNDWLNGDWIKQQHWPKQGGSVPNELLATAFFARSTQLVAKMADRLGYRKEEIRYRTLSDRIKQAFQQRFVRPDCTMTGDTQAGYALALSFDLLPEIERPQAAQHLVDAIHRYGDHLSTGIQTTHRAMLELCHNGYDGLAWQLITNRTFPSWLYMVDNGATTIWERWDGYVTGRGFQDPGMNSLNHWALGAVGEWMWRYIIGLNPDEQNPGWKHFVVAPRPGGGVTWARGGFHSIHGLIETAWRTYKDSFALDVVVPPNTTATVILPTEGVSGTTESGIPVSQARDLRLQQSGNGQVILEIVSGQYHFRSPLANSSDR